jgi:NADPH-dependent curcumin reductase CurA
MKQTKTTNRRFILAERPNGAPTESTLSLETTDVHPPHEGEVLLRTEFLSLDPYMRGRMNDTPSYAPPVKIGDVMVGGTVAQVVASKLEGFKEGDWVLSANGWQDYALSDGEGVTKLDSDPEHLSWALGVTGMPGFTAWAGLTKIGQLKAGKIHYRKEIVDGLEAAPATFIGMLQGNNFGKCVIRVGSSYYF